MAMLYWKVKAYLEANGKTESEFDNIKLRNDGSGDYIHTWNVSGFQPTDSQLTSADTQATKDYNNRIRKLVKILRYREQLDEIYRT